MDCHTTALMATIATWCQVVYCAFAYQLKREFGFFNFSNLICLQKHVFPPWAPTGKFMEFLERGDILCFIVL